VHRRHLSNAALPAEQSLKRILWSALLCGAFGSAAHALAQDGGFSEERLRAGIEAVKHSRSLQAVDEFRIAAFGFLNRPPLLAECVVRLALLQESLGRQDDVSMTLARFAEIENRVGGFAQARLEERTRRVFRELAARRLAPAIFASLRALGAPGVAAVTPAAAPASKPPEKLRADAEMAERPPAEPGRDAEETPTAPATDADRAAESAAPASPEPSPAQDLEVEEPPRTRKVVSPAYPVQARVSGVRGTVLLRVLVSESGTPLQIHVVRPIRPDLSAEAARVIRQWTFEPGRRNGVPVRAWITVAVPFEP
jgi:protein TonB